MERKKIWRNRENICRPWLINNYSCAQNDNDICCQEADWNSKRNYSTNGLCYSWLLFCLLNEEGYKYGKIVFIKKFREEERRNKNKFCQPQVTFVL